MFNNFELTINMGLGNQFTCFTSNKVQILKYKYGSKLLAPAERR